MPKAKGSVDSESAFEGYASLFGRMDEGRDVVLPGAFGESLRRRAPRGVRMLFQHDANQPIGVWTELFEDARGLYAKGRLLTDVARAREVLSLMRAGAIDGLSIGFRTISGRTDRSGVRHLSKIDLWEVSVVTFPMLAEARVRAVKAGYGCATPHPASAKGLLAQTQACASLSHKGRGAAQ